MATTNELKWFRKILEKNSNFEILSISEPYANKGNCIGQRIREKQNIKSYEVKRNCFACLFG